MFDQNCEEIIKHPHLVIKDEKNDNTIFMIRHIEDTNVNVVVKIATVDDEKHPKNSIMTSYRIRNRNVKKLKKKRIKYFTNLNKCSIMYTIEKGYFEVENVRYAPVRVKKKWERGTPAKISILKKGLLMQSLFLYKNLIKSSVYF